MSHQPPDDKPNLDFAAATATADEVVAALFDRQHEVTKVENERQHPRRTWSTTLTIWLRKDRWDIAREMKVRTQDVSRGGFSFLHSHYLHTETLISTRFDLLPSQPIVSGIVKSCVYNGDGKHRVGVEFLEASPSDDR